MTSTIHTPYGHLTDEELLREAYFTDKTLTILEVELLKRLELKIDHEDTHTVTDSVRERSRASEPVV